MCAADNCLMRLCTSCARCERHGNYRVYYDMRVSDRWSQQNDVTVNKIDKRSIIKAMRDRHPGVEFSNKLALHADFTDLDLILKIEHEEDFIRKRKASDDYDY